MKHFSLTIKSSPQKNTLLKVAQANAENKTCKSVFFSPTQEKLKNKKSPTLQKNKTSFQCTLQTLADIASIINIFGQSMHKLGTTHIRTDRGASGNTGLAKVVVSYSADTFVVNQSLVLRNNPEVSGW